MEERVLSEILQREFLIFVGFFSGGGGGEEG